MNERHRGTTMTMYAYDFVSLLWDTHSSRGESIVLAKNQKHNSSKKRKKPQICAILLAYMSSYNTTWFVMLEWYWGQTCRPITCCSYACPSATHIFCPPGNAAVIPGISYLTLTEQKSTIQPWTNIFHTRYYWLCTHF